MIKNISVKQSNRKLNDIVNYIFLMLDMAFRNWARSSNRALDTKAYTVLHVTLHHRLH